MIEIFKDYKNISYQKLAGQTKAPFSKYWQKNPHTYQEARNHLNKGLNYGVMGGYGGLIIIDVDKPSSTKDKNIKFKEFDNELYDIIKSKLPETLEVQTGSGGHHFYFFCEDIDKKIIFKSKRNKNEIHWGEIISNGSQAVGPGSVHPETKKKYKIINKKKIQKIDKNLLFKELCDFLPTVQQSLDNVNIGSDIDELNVLKIWGTSGLKKSSDGSYFGPHPQHGSSGGMNFWINPEKNAWHCFRCGSGGGPAAAIAVKHNIINCSNSIKGSLKGEDFIKVLQIAHNIYGLPKKEKEEVIQKEPELLNLWTFKDFENYEIDNNYLVDRILYPKTVNMLYSPPGEFKSIMGVYMALSIATGNDWCTYKTKQNAVLYCDKENNDKIIKERLMAIYKGHEYKNKDMPLYFLRREGDLIKNKRADYNFIQKLFYTIETYEIKVVFFDTMHRFGDYDENSSDDINTLYTQVFQPLIEKYNCAVVFLHHTTKEGVFRGSGDFLGMVDTAYKFKRVKKTGDVNIVNDKNRGGEIEQMKANIEFTENEQELLETIEITVYNQEDKKQNDDFYKKVRSCVKEGEMKYKRDIKAELENDLVSFSESKLKRALTWCLDNDIFERDKMHRYKLK